MRTITIKLSQLGADYLPDLAAAIAKMLGDKFHDVGVTIEGGGYTIYSYSGKVLGRISLEDEREETTRRG
jgi:hypothetical protein